MCTASNLKVEKPKAMPMLLYSHLPLPDFSISTPLLPETIATIKHLSSVPITAAKVKRQTDRDPIQCKVKRYTQHSWPDKLNGNEAELKPYFHRKQELSLKDGIRLHF